MGNTYTKVADAGNGNDHAALYYAKNVTGGTLTISSSVGGTIAAEEYTGVSSYTPLDKVASSTGSSARPSPGSVTAAQGRIKKVLKSR